MQSKEMIKEFIQAELVQDSKYSSLGDSDPLIESGIIDSLGMMKLIGFLEEKLSVHLSDDELIPENFSSVDAISTLVSQKSAA